MNSDQKRPNRVVLLSVIIALLLTMTTLGVLSNAVSSNSVSQGQHSSSKLQNNMLPVIGSQGYEPQVNPFSLYSGEPAPMGLADYGIGPNSTPYIYNTTSFLGGVSINSINVVNNSTSNKDMSFQFNVNLVFGDGINTYVYWVQDVAFLNTSTNGIYFIDNVWNMSSPSQTMYNTSITGNGTVDNTGGSRWDYDFAGQFLPGNKGKIS